MQSQADKITCNAIRKEAEERKRQTSTRNDMNRGNSMHIFSFVIRCMSAYSQNNDMEKQPSNYDTVEQNPAASRSQL